MWKLHDFFISFFTWALHKHSSFVGFALFHFFQNSQKSKLFTNIVFHKIPIKKPSATSGKSTRNRGSALRLRCNELSYSSQLSLWPFYSINCQFCAVLSITWVALPRQHQVPCKTRILALRVLLSSASSRLSMPDSWLTWLCGWSCALGVVSFIFQIPG